MLLCSTHRLPENHECPFDLKKSSEFENLITKWDILYQDALDFMNTELTVAKIYEYVTTKQMTKDEAIELLGYILETSENTEIRRISILAFRVLELESDKIFTVLESCILSDEDPIVIKTAAEVIQQIFPKKSLDILKWVKTQNKG